MVTYNEVYNTYIKLLTTQGRATCDRVAEDLYKRGIMPNGYDKPYSRQRIRVILSTQPQGRALIYRSTAHNAKPIIVDKRKGIVEWLQRHGLEGIPVVEPDMAIVKNAHVYGDLPISFATEARSIWLVVNSQGVPIVADIPAYELEKANAKLCEVKVRTIK